MYACFFICLDMTTSCQPSYFFVGSFPQLLWQSEASEVNQNPIRSSAFQSCELFAMVLKISFIWSFGLSTSFSILDHIEGFLPFVSYGIRLAFSQISGWFFPKYQGKWIKWIQTLHTQPYQKKDVFKMVQVSSRNSQPFASFCNK